MSILLMIAATTSQMAGQVPDCRTRFIPAANQSQTQRDTTDTRRRQPAQKPDRTERPARPCYILASA